MSSESVQAITVFGHKNGWGKKIEKVSKGMYEKVIGIDKDDTQEDVAEALRNSQLAFLAAPDTEIPKIIQAHRNRLLKMQVLDCATNKGLFEEELRKLAEVTSITSTHPMIISSSPTRGQNVIIMPIGENSDPSKQNALKIYGGLEMEPKILSFEKHGDRMAVMQNIPHLIQRIGIHLMRYEIERRGLSYEEICDIAPANAQITDLALGRVGMQRPDVSAGIVHQAFKKDDGRKAMEEMIDELKRLIAACEKDDREDLINMFSEEIAIFDPTGGWRRGIKQKTDVHLEAMGNFKKKSFTLVSYENKPGLLRRICEVMEARDINITAIHSNETEEEGSTVVRFDIGIGKEDLDWNGLQTDLETLELKFERVLNE